MKVKLLLLVLLIALSQSQAAIIAEKQQINQKLVTQCEFFITAFGLQYDSARCNVFCRNMGYISGSCYGDKCLCVVIGWIIIIIIIIIK